MILIFKVSYERDRGIVVYGMRRQGDAHNWYHFGFTDQQLHRHSPTVRKVVRREGITRSRTMVMEITGGELSMYYSTTSDRLRYYAKRLESSSDIATRVATRFANLEIGKLKRKSTRAAKAMTKETSELAELEQLKKIQAEIDQQTKLLVDDYKAKAAASNSTDSLG